MFVSVLVYIVLEKIRFASNLFFYEAGFFIYIILCNNASVLSFHIEFKMV